MTARQMRWLRLFLLGAVVAWFLSPPDWRYAVPLWLPFAAALFLELQFFVSGWRAQASRRTGGRLPQPGDLEEFGWGEELPDEEDPAFWHSPPVPRARRNQSLRRIGGSILIIAVVALVAWGVSVRRGWSSLDTRTQARIERILSREARVIAAHPVQVRCDTQGRHVGVVQEADGRAEVGGTRAWLTPGICFRLYRLIDKHDTHSFSATGRAVAVLAHESWHLRGTSDEGITNCYAFQSGVDIGMHLGLQRARAEALMTEQLADNASDAGADSRYLVPSGCRNGGRYDLKPRSASFP